MKALKALLPRNWTIRVRLSVLYGGLFFVAGLVLLAVTYLLVKQRLISHPFGYDRSQIQAIPGFEPTKVDPRALDRLQSSIREAQAEYRRQTLDTLLAQGAVALALVGVAAFGFGWLVAARVLRPLHRITETAQRIAGSETVSRGLHERIALEGPHDEIRQLAETFDSMLERLDRSFDGQRRFVANASHELRTPLAINRALIELAITRPEAPDETRALGESLLTINSRHERLIDGLLTLADSENAITDRSTVDLAEVAGHLVELARPAAADAGLELLADLDPAPTTGDPILLERLAQNLVDNAIRHNQRGGWLSVRTRATEVGGAELIVSNTGAAVPRYEVETIFQPFRRLAVDRPSPERGFGLGLSIVAAVARAHGARVVAVPREGGGLTVTVTLPAARA
jgi:signal transduction histidine kinase